MGKRSEAKVIRIDDREAVGTRAPEGREPVPARRRELALATAIAAGDETAFERFHAEYRDRVYAFALKRLRDAAEADDVCQDVFVQVLRCIGSFEGRSSLLTWLFGVTHHQICRRHRRRHADAPGLDANGVSEIAAEQAPVDRQVDAARLLEDCGTVLTEQVSEAQQEVFRLRYADGQSMKQIAATLGKSCQAVKISLFRTRRTLSAELERRGIAVPA